MISEDAQTIAVDFDGTIVEHSYPRIGREMLFAFDTLLALQKKGHKLLLWTFRSGELLDEAVEYCRENGVVFYAVNKSYPEEVYDKSISRKVSADIFIDDRNIGGFVGWGEVFQMLHPEGGDFKHGLKFPDAHHNFKGDRSVIEKIFGSKWSSSRRKKK